MTYGLAFNPPLPASYPKVIPTVGRFKLVGYSERSSRPRLSEHWSGAWRQSFASPEFTPGLGSHKGARQGMFSDAGAGSSGRKRGYLEIRQGQPMSFSQIEDIAEAAQPDEKEQKSSRVAATIKVYRDSAKDLLAGKYQDLRPFAPAHLTEPCNVLVVSCVDGVLIRYDVPTEGPHKVRSTVIDKPLAEVAPPFSEFVIHFPANPESYDPGTNGPVFELVKFGPNIPDQPIARFRSLVYAVASFPEGTTSLPPPHKPPCLVSMTNELQVLLSGAVLPADSGPPNMANATHEFVARARPKLQVGWQAIEVYPPADPAYWKPEYATVWAETDLLAAVARRQFADAQFSALDPNVTARKTFRELLERFTALLDGPEEPLHQFLKGHPQLLCPAHTKSWSKLPFGDRVSDFVFREPGNEYLLVEIESPLRELFRKDGQQRQELTHAFNQILDWRVYLEDNLQTAREQLGLTGIPSNPRSLIVIGRSSTLTDENRRKIVTLQSQVPRLRILTYEELLETAKATAENFFGPLDFIGENIDIYLRPT
jgi:hypothetical protein